MPFENFFNHRYGHGSRYLETSKEPVDRRKFKLKLVCNRQRVTYVHEIAIGTKSH